MLSSLFAYKWNDASRSRLAELVERGFTSKQIARSLSIEFGISYSRNSVIAQCGQIGLQLKGKSRRPAVPPPTRVTLGSTKIAPPEAYNIPKRVRSDVDPVPEPDPAGDVASGCRWLHGDAVDRIFCGAEAFRRSRYCQHHFARVYDEPPPQDEAKRRRLAKWLSKY